MTQAFNMDCMEAMKQFPDKFFDLAVVDPPYGGGARGIERETGLGAEISYNGAITGRFGGHFEKYHLGGGRSKSAGREEHGQRNIGCTKGGIFSKDIRSWDVAPDDDYFKELARVSRNQIIFGGNYFRLPPTRCFIVWRKTNIPLKFTMAPCEYAWTSFNQNAVMFECSSAGTKKNPRFHPTQKPIKLYAMIYEKFAQPGFKILDTHLGSGSSRLAAYDAGLDFWGYELDETYFDLQEKRFEEYTAQMKP